ncbi:hypothetical protein [Vagococcus lutrae]|nr:hypothetical protein [Vagococcus lutrae]MCO7151716.1 hypothetical protein [Vagococcus lutrae]MDT2841860.1 hypothetical protein [Vagococcus lutrae]UQF24241.1 hypothetical protein M2909_04440 [Vagococcus lutrae]UQF37778.1 hypothetical protein M2904_06530 [Vagococcus lutrae]UQF63669.1 hypothetical protein M2908_07275 [Vagococcus lutrae]
MKRKFLLAKVGTWHSPVKRIRQFQLLLYLSFTLNIALIIALIVTLLS